MEFFTSDLHFGHKNIIKYCNRPFRDIDHMKQELIARWNSVVGSEDMVYVLGDFSFTKNNETSEILRVLNGNKWLIVGNHDKDPDTMRSLGFGVVIDYMNYQGYLMCHYPLDERSHIPQLCGHVHTSWKYRGPQINVGVDVWDYTPRTLAELKSGKSK